MDWTDYSPEPTNISQTLITSVFQGYVKSHGLDRLFPRVYKYLTDPHNFCISELCKVPWTGQIIPQSLQISHRPSYFCISELCKVPWIGQIFPRAYKYLTDPHNFCISRLCKVPWTGQIIPQSLQISHRSS